MGVPTAPFAVLASDYLSLHYGGMTISKVLDRDGNLEAAVFHPRFLRLADNFVRLWSYPLLGRWWSRILLLVLVSGLCALRAFVGLMGTQGYSHDAFMVFDGAWRMMNGQRPHVDFYSHLGLLTYAPTAVGLWIARGSASAYGYGQALMGLLVGFWAYFVGRRYLSDVPACLLCLAVVSVAVSPSELGEPPLLVGGMTYNRHGYAILAILLVEVLAGGAAELKRNSFLGGLSTGAALAILLFLKITYFVFGAFLVLALIPVKSQGKSRFAGLTIGLVGVSSCLCAYLEFHLIPMGKDLATIFGAKHFHPLYFSFDKIFQDVAVFLVFIFMTAALLSLHKNPQAARAITIGGLAVTATSLLIFGNYEQSGFQMAAFMAIISIDIVSGTISVTSSRTGPLHVSVLLLASAFVLTTLTSGLIALSQATIVRLRTAPYSKGFNAPRLATFKPVAGDEAYGSYVNDGLALLQRYRAMGETVMSLDFTNPFSYGLGIRPAPGGATVLQYRTTFDDKHRQSAQSLFGHSDLVMLPQPGHFSDPTLDYSIVRIYGSYLEKHFTLVGSSHYWQLYRRNVSKLNG